MKTQGAEFLSGRLLICLVVAAHVVAVLFSNETRDLIIFSAWAFYLGVGVGRIPA